MAMASSRNGAIRGSMRPISGANSSNLRSSSFKSRIPSAAPAPRRNSSASVGGASAGDSGGPLLLLSQILLSCQWNKLCLRGLLSFKFPCVSSAWESSSGCEITTSKRRWVGGRCWFCWLRRAAAWGSLQFHVNWIELESLNPWFLFRLVFSLKGWNWGKTIGTRRLTSLMKCLPKPLHRSESTKWLPSRL